MSCGHQLKYTFQPLSQAYQLVSPPNGLPYNFVCNKCMTRGTFPNYQCLSCQFDLCMSCSMVSPWGGTGSSLDHVAAINKVAKPLGFSCVPVSWEDASRSKVTNFGPNIADVRLVQRDESLLYSCRSQNWNERLAVMSSKEIALVVGNGKHGSISDTISLNDLLNNSQRHLGYSGITSTTLTAPQDDNVSVRFQAVFIPLSANLEFCTEVYSYNTREDTNPRNMLLLATPQGTSVQLDGRDRQRLYYHSVGHDGSIHRYWLEAEKSEHRVGQAQHETVTERNDAIARGKAVAVHFGPPALGRRFNAQLLIQVPLKQSLSTPFGVPLPIVFGDPTSFGPVFGASAPSFGPVFGASPSSFGASSSSSTSAAAFSFGAPQQVHLALPQLPLPFLHV